MSDLHSTFSSALIERFAAHAARIRELAAALDDAQFWQKPFSFGNSFGHLVLHLTGNLNYYVGAQIANTGYVRDRPREFADASPPSKAETLQQFDAAVAMVQESIRTQSLEDWSSEYSAVGTKVPNRLAIFLVCESHMQLHIGQMIYLGYELQRAEAGHQRRED
jgi:hypothetical protein